MRQLNTTEINQICGAGAIMAVATFPFAFMASAIYLPLSLLTSLPLLSEGEYSKYLKHVATTPLNVFLALEGLAYNA